MSSVIASNIPSSVTPAKVREFFSFCGKIEDLQSIEENGKFKSYRVLFSSEKAVSTALLLNDAELDNSFIKVEEDKLNTVAKEISETVPTSDAVHSGDKTYDDVAQEDKPKYAIFAQLLADGYVLGDPILEKGIDFDKKNGISQQFQSFISGLDEKYIHSQDPESKINQQLKSLNDNYYKSSLSKYFDAAAKSSIGTKIHEYYKKFSNDVKDVHEEAKRLAAIKLQEKEGEQATTATATEKPTI